MTRTAARELAVLILASGPEDPGVAVEAFFEPEHYATLAAEGEQFARRPDEKQLAYIRTVAETVAGRRAELDGYIEACARGWRVSRLSSVTAAILRCALCEILYIDDVPAGAAIDEAVELAKKYEDENAPGFINGVLGAFVRSRAEAGAEADTEPEAEA